MTADELSDDDDDLHVEAPELPPLVADAEPVDITVEARAHGWRLDHYLGRLFPNHSRAQLQRIIESGGVLLNGLNHKASRRLRVNDRLQVRLVAAERPGIEPENLPIGILYEDDALVVVNKPAGMVVHPGRGSSRGTLAAALQFHFDQLSDVAGRHRPGIVHRLDRDTTGVILIAKDNQVHQKIAAAVRTPRSEEGVSRDRAGLSAA
ncbi:MAG UNVERIFIED_CONTAM: RluA family pseudouridine synthase [Planctomycetaceae bacterium]|jgi:23S rRNA pseudouridine1911/1915/1917 synthase